jgi:hypothetical protein
MRVRKAPRIDREIVPGFVVQIACVSLQGPRFRPLMRLVLVRTIARCWLFGGLLLRPPDLLSS